MMPLWLDLAASKPGLGCLGPIVMAFPFRLKQRKMVWELRGRDIHMKSGRVFIILHWQIARQLRLSTDSWISLDTINYSFPTSLLWHFHIVEILWKERKQIYLVWLQHFNHWNSLQIFAYSSLPGSNLSRKSSKAVLFKVLWSLYIKSSWATCFKKAISKILLNQSLALVLSSTFHTSSLNDSYTH